MHIKESPVEGIKREFAGFELDASKIDLHSVSKDKIYLPYGGPLPDTLSENEGAVVSVNITVGLVVRACLIVTASKKEHRYPVEATAQEISDLLFPFFSKDVGNNKFHTRFGNGLSDYWMGSYQSSFTNWKHLVLEEHGLDNLLFQLSPTPLKECRNILSIARQLKH